MKCHWPTSGALVLPTTIAPAVAQAAHRLGVALGRRGARRRSRRRSAWPARSTSSLIATGTPSSGARSPAARRRSASSASASACLGADDAEGVEGRLRRLDPRQRALDQLPRARPRHRRAPAPARQARRSGSTGLPATSGVGPRRLSAAVMRASTAMRAPRLGAKVMARRVTRSSRPRSGRRPTRSRTACEHDLHLEEGEAGAEAAADAAAEGDPLVGAGRVARGSARGGRPRAPGRGRGGGAAGRWRG